jgi:hypothetical protein
VKVLVKLLVCNWDELERSNEKSVGCILSILLKSSGEDKGSFGLLLQTSLN